MASDRKKNIDQLFKSKLEDHSSEVPPSLWNKISTELDTKEVEAPVAEAPKRRSRASWFLKIAAGLLLFGFVIWKVQPEKKTHLSKEDLTVDQSQVLAQRQDQVENRDGLSEQSDGEGAQRDSAEEIPLQSTEGSRPTGESRETRLAYKEVGTEYSNDIPDVADVAPSEETEVLYTQLPADLSQSPVEGVAAVDEAVVLTEVTDNEPAKKESEIVPLPDSEVIVAGEEEEVLANSTLSDSYEKIDVDEGSASLPLRERPKILSGVLNFVANNLQVGGNQIVEFNETDQGILRVDVKPLFDK